MTATTRILNLPVKRSQALLGGNLPRDSRLQVACNNAKKGNSWYFAVPPLLNLLFKPCCLYLKKTQYDQRAKRFLFLMQIHQ